ncbi:MAG TPA: MerR family transcriptional regulator [Thermoanaerobaculia bacterium]
MGAVARRTGIPVTTLRFYERELPSLFPIRKTAGGHRRYDGRDVSRFATVRSLTSEGIPLAELRRALLSRGENEALREAIERLSERQETASDAVAAIARRLAELEARVAALESRPPGRNKGWFGRA